MRVALLSAVETITDGERGPKAFTRIAGRSILERQLDFAQAMGCEQIACLSNSLHPELIDLQHCAEKDGRRFQVLRDIRPLSGLVKAADEVLVIADGLLFDQALAESLMGKGRAVLTLPAETAVPLGFERLDREFAWAGTMMISGSLIERLGEMPSDVDPQSSLLRLALQSGASTLPINQNALSDYDWMAVQTSEDITSFKSRWLGAVSEPASLAAPVSASADHAALAVVKRHVDPLKAARAVSGIAYTLMGVALISAYFSYPIAGFVVAAIGAFAARFSLTTSAIVGSGREIPRGTRILAQLPPTTLDLVLICLVVLSVPIEVRAVALFAAFVLVGLLRLAVIPQTEGHSRKLQDLFEDRGLLAIGLGAALIAGQILLATQIIAALLLGLLLFQTYSARITRA